MRGQGTSVGIGIGKVFLYREAKYSIQKKNIEDYNIELEKLSSSVKKASIEIDKLYSKIIVNMGKKEAEIFLAHKMMIEDPNFIGSIREKIKDEKINAEWAVKEISDEFLAMFENIEDEYLRSRALDVKDISDRILRILLSIEDRYLSSIDENSIIVAKCLTPSDIAAINKKKIVGIVTELGGINSHTSIIARTLEIPAIIGVDGIILKVNHGDDIIIDGDSGEILLHPKDEDFKIYIDKLKKENSIKENLKKLIGRPTVSKDEYRVELSGNIGNLSDIDNVLKNDGEGVGLFRSEFLYMDSKEIPTEDEQLKVYKEAALKLKDKHLIIRTLDAGGDKEISYLDLPKEINPFLGYRAIRIGLDRPEILKTQLRAIYRASNYGNIKIMFPMISSIEELRQAKEIAKSVREELQREAIDFKEDVEIGIMVEIPAVAIHSRAFAKEVDFFSIGTNDLIQYTIAVDRDNQKISKLYNQYHPGVLRLIKMVIDAGHSEGIPVAMCGEAAGDKRLIPVLLGMGLDEFSMSSSSILKAKYQIRCTSKKDIEKHIEKIINLSTSEDVEKYIDINILKTPYFTSDHK